MPNPPKLIDRSHSSAVITVISPINDAPNSNADTHELLLRLIADTGLTLQGLALPVSQFWQQSALHSGGYGAHQPRGELESGVECE